MVKAAVAERVAHVKAEADVEEETRHHDVEADEKEGVSSVGHELGEGEEVEHRPGPEEGDM